jgi:hypothetical protein
VQGTTYVGAVSPRKPISYTTIRQATAFLIPNHKRNTMTSIRFPRKGDKVKERELSEDFQESINPFRHESNITDGAEFLDDNIRMKDQPLDIGTVNETE